MWSSLLLLSVVAVCCGLGDRPRYIGCLTSDECGKNECCVIGMGRYSIPTCQPRRQLGDPCRPLGEPVNTTLHYPDGAVVELSAVYYITCPCQGGMTCGGDMACEDEVRGNNLEEEYSEENDFLY